MAVQYHFSTTEEERARRRADRSAARRQRRRLRRRAMLLRALPPLLVLLAAGGLLALLAGNGRDAPLPEPPPMEYVPPAGEPAPAAVPPPAFSARTTPETAALGEEFSSGCAVLIDVESGTVLAEKNAFQAVSPASMTKILTLLVAVEALEGLEGTASVTQAITDYCFENQCSTAGFLAGEEVGLEDLLYGTILPSGADAALALAEYVSGSEEAFVERMNEKAEELGLAARFAGCVGLYHPETRCSVYDMAVILQAALENPTCRQVLSARTWFVPAAGEREALELSNWFIRRIEDHMPAGFEIQGAKTGFVTEAGNCAASCAQGPDGRTYLCVTAQGAGIWPCIFDHVALYQSVAGTGAED